MTNVLFILYVLIYINCLLLGGWSELREVSGTERETRSPEQREEETEAENAERDTVSKNKKKLNQLLVIYDK